MASEENLLISKPCKSCGGQMRFEPKVEMLQCENCNATEPIPKANDLIVEENFRSALRSKTENEGMGIETKSYACSSCGAVTVASTSSGSFSCSFCGAEKVNPEAFQRKMIQPAGVLPFCITKNDAQTKFKEWIGGGWFHPSDLQKRAKLAMLDGVYLPHWTYDAETESSWTAEAGYYYYVEVPYTDAQGKQQTRREQRVRWEPARGYYQHFFDDVLVVASKGVKQNMIEQINPFPLNKLLNYKPEFILGFKSEAYALDVEQGFEVADRIMDGEIKSACIRMIPGDTHRNLHINTRKDAITFKHILLPIWISAYKYSDKTYQFIVNGQTGKTAGDKPLSWVKITLVSLLAIAIIAVIAYFYSKYK